MEHWEPLADGRAWVYGDRASVVKAAGGRAWRWTSFEKNGKVKSTGTATVLEVAQDRAARSAMCTRQRRARNRARSVNDTDVFIIRRVRQLRADGLADRLIASRLRVRLTTIERIS